MMKRITLAAALLLGFAASPAQPRAEDEALVTFRSLSPSVALDLARAVLDSCHHKGFQVAVAVVDRFGTPQVMLRDQFAGPHTPDTATAKAWTAISFRSDTLKLAASTAGDQPQSGARFIAGAVMLGGGLPVEAGGSIVGGVGVSGGPSGEADDACARTGIAAVEDKLF
ncbi:heme-binding protein [Skermanella sp. TT6]|uniref:Heme-binding protein n=1 Tax=Skermanella cutis TaxID=2775420 RepID=A0ABX7B3R8_9PROT|nr:heme-binding protein [Skermanella sp. TT6]QQP88957.1 heme-binding protein [Skermanella sp. TT6]